MKCRKIVLSFFTVGACGILLLSQSAPQSYPVGQDWTNYVRIGAYGLRGGDAAEIVRKAEASNVFGIEFDNDIPGRYESFVHPEEKLQAIHEGRGGCASCRQ